VGVRIVFRIHWRDSVQFFGNFEYRVRFLRYFVFCGYGIHFFINFVFLGYGIRFFINFVFCGYRVRNMEFKWSLDENMCVLFSMMSVLDARQQAMVTVRRKFVDLNNLGIFAYYT
jgi:hypothetical protein